MADIASKVAQIRQATYGKDVRESIASGIEAINSEVVNTTNRQNAIDAQEATRQSNENTRIANENQRQTQEQNRINTFNTNEGNRQSLFSTNENQRQTQEQNRMNTFNTNETARSDTFNTNETERDAVIAQFKAWYNSSSLTGRLPFVIDGGNFGDSRTGATYDGGNFGDPR